MIEFEKMTWKEIEEYLKENRAILIPTGVYEEHGFHLPVSTDNVIGLEITRNVAEKLDIILAPLIPFGVSRKTRGFPGSIMLQFETFIRLVEDILSIYVENGFKKIIIFSFHGSDNHLIGLKEAAYIVKKKKSLIDDLDFYIISSKDLADNRILKLLKSVPIHSGELETSLILYLAENLVKMDKAVQEYPKFPEFELLLTGKPWMKTGVMGDATKGTIEKGKVLFDIFVENLVNKIKNSCLS